MLFYLIYYLFYILTTASPIYKYFKKLRAVVNACEESYSGCWLENHFSLGTEGQYNSSEPVS